MGDMQRHGKRWLEGSTSGPKSVLGGSSLQTHGPCEHFAATFQLPSDCGGVGGFVRAAEHLLQAWDQRASMAAVPSQLPYVFGT